MMVNGNAKKVKNIREILIQVMIVILVLAAATLISMLIRYLGFPETNIVVIYILSVLVIASLTKGYIYGAAASLIGMFGFNFFFTEPLHTLNVYNKSYIITFAVMLTASVLTSTLTSKILRSSTEAKQREKQSQILYQITSSLAKTSSISDVATVSVQCLSNLLDCDVSFIVTEDEENPNRKYSLKKGERGVTVNPVNVDDLGGELEDKFVLPIAGQSNQYGMICLPQDSVAHESEQNKLVLSLSTQIFVAMEREFLFREKERAKNDAEREKFKSNLLRSISHDLRTPLSGITGASEVLLYNLHDEDGRKLVQGIYDDSIWLTQMVENILSLTKIQEGSLIANKKYEAVEEIVGAAVNRIKKYAGNCKISVVIPQEVVMVPMDGKLIVQVLVNLLDNALKHSNENDEIKVEVRSGKTYAWFSVSDHGPGINPEDLTKIFDLFYVSDGSRVDSKRGSGLGLTICKAIVNSHGGNILAENNAEGGATIRFSLPLKGGNDFGKS